MTHKQPIFNHSNEAVVLSVKSDKLLLRALSGEFKSIHYAKISCNISVRSLKMVLIVIYICIGDKKLCDMNQIQLC